MSGLLRGYRSFLEDFPILSQCVQTGILMGTGDVLAQTVVNDKELKNVDLKRTIQFGGVGFFFVVCAILDFENQTIYSDDIVILPKHKLPHERT